METGGEMGLYERQLLISSDISILREELLQKAKDTVDTFLADMDEKMNTNKNGNLYIHCNQLICKTIDTKLEELIETVDEIKSDIASAYDIFEKKCYPIMDGKLPIPAPILARSKELLHEDEDEPDKYNKARTVTDYEEQIGCAVNFMLDDVNPKDNNNTDGNYVEYGIDNTDSDTETEENHVEYGIDFRLDFKRDTIEEVKNIVNLYPEAIDDENLPKVTDNISLRSVLFIPSIVSLWMEYNQFSHVDEIDCHMIIKKICQLRLKNPVCDKNRFFDQQCANVMQWFIDKELVVASDTFMEHENYINDLIKNGSSPVGFFIEQRLQVLVNLRPAALELPNDDNPLLNAAYYSPIGQYECFISVLMAGIHNLTKNNGILLLFRNTSSLVYHHPPNITPFARFINRWLKEEKPKRLDAIHNALNDPILCRHHPPYDTAHAIFKAATSEQISLDGVFFFFTERTRRFTEIGVA